MSKKTDKNFVCEHYWVIAKRQREDRGICGRCKGDYPTNEEAIEVFEKWHRDDPNAELFIIRAME